MKRDIDLSRQLLLDIEGRGADCSVSVLRTGPNHEAQERIRYHLRLLIDAGLLKEVDRAANGVPCVRLTDSGHELVELSRSDRRWREAKLACRESGGNASLGAVRSILFHWVVAGRPLGRRRGHFASAYELADASQYGRLPAYRVERADRAEPFAAESPERYEDAEIRYVRVRPPRPHGWRRDAVELNGTASPEPAGAPTLPDYLI